jgi:RND family efflux transporter MFP subunit
MTEFIGVGEKAEVGPRERPQKAPTTAHKGRGTRQAFLAALLLLLSGLAFGVWRHYEQSSLAAESARQRRDFIARVRVETVKKSSGVTRVSLPASIDAFETANIYSRASGFIAKRYVDIGSKVTTGQKLADITAPELEDQINQAEAALEQAEASLRQSDANRELARVTNSRTSVLAKQGWATKQQGDTDRLNLLAQQNAAQAATANVQTQKAQVRVLRQKKSYLEVLAPFDGVVTQRNVDVGSLVQADSASGTFMFQVMRGNVVRVQTYVPQDQAFGLTAGVDALIRVPEIPGRDFPGKVTRVADALQPATRTLQAEVDVQNPDGALVPGAYCMVELLVPRKTKSFLLPSGAIIFNQHDVHVAVVKDGVAHLQQIVIARDLGKEIEVNGGVEDGDQVIVRPPVDLKDGQRVEIRAASTASTP